MGRRGDNIEPSQKSVLTNTCVVVASADCTVLGRIVLNNFMFMYHCNSPPETSGVWIHCPQTEEIKFHSRSQGSRD